MIGKVGGSKDHPLPVIGGTLQEDNVSIEMAIDPAPSLEEFLSKTKQVMAELTKKVEENGCSVVIEPSVEFSEEVLQMFAPSSMESGCDPDYNVYSNKENEFPDIMQIPYRHGSGHLHIDCPLAVENVNARNSLVYLCDILIKAPQWLVEGDVLRNRYTGALGNFRPKSYGIEYRSGSNIILKDEKILSHAYRAAVLASSLIKERTNIGVASLMYLQESMRKGKKDAVVNMIKDFGGELIPC
jgi:hypothetical protein